MSFYRFEPVQTQLNMMQCFKMLNRIGSFDERPNLEMVINFSNCIHCIFKLYCIQHPISSRKNSTVIEGACEVSLRFQVSIQPVYMSNKGVARKKLRGPNFVTLKSDVIYL